MADLAVGDIIKNITDDVKLLVQDQIELAKAELTPAAKQGGTGIGLFGAAGYFALSATILLYFAAAFGLVCSRPCGVARVLDRGRGAAADLWHPRWNRVPDRPEDQGTGAHDRPGQSVSCRAAGCRGTRCGCGKRATDRRPGSSTD